MDRTKLLRCKIETPLGNIFVSGNKDTITTVSWEPLNDEDIPEHAGELNWFAEELSLYMKGLLKVFTGELSFENSVPVWLRNPQDKIIPNNLPATVLKIISGIPYGKTKTYGSIATLAGNKGFARAVGRICGKNPLVIIVPCHRVIAASTIGGYSAGLEKKRYLMQIEGVDIQAMNP
jgi:methylated-DNA-[protein]-cysteine S-methyltransferase